MGFDMRSQGPGNYSRIHLNIWVPENNLNSVREELKDTMFGEKIFWINCFFIQASKPISSISS